MINVNQITSQLAKMPDQALQKYAAMHKSDPYIVALAVAESNRRKEIRSGAQMQAQPQPKVVDAELQGMAAPMPESVGIGALPAGDMQFADGGIVAFADGGDVERYNGTETSLTGEQMPYGEQMRRALGALFVDAPVGAFRRLVSDPSLDERPRAAPSLSSLPSADYSNESRRVPAPSPAQASDAAAAAVAPTKTDYSVLRTPGMGQAGGLGGINVEKATQQAIDFASKQANPFAKELEAVAAEKKTAAEAKREGLKAIHEKFSDIYKGKEERLKQREGEIGEMKDQHLGLALLQAGAAMMSTPGNLGTAIGKGVDVGTKQYAMGMERVRSAKEKLADARDRLDELQAQRGEMTAREALNAENEVRQIAVSAREDMLKSNQQMYGVNRDTALKMLDNQIKLQIAQSENATRLQAASLPGAQERIALLLGGGDLAKGLARFTDIQAGKFNPMTAYTDYVSKRKEGDTVLTPAEFVTQIRSVQALMSGAPGASDKPTGKVFE